MTEHDQLRSRIADIIEYERESGTTMPGSADLAGLTKDEWTADRIIREVIHPLPPQLQQYGSKFLKDMES